MKRAELKPVLEEYIETYAKKSFAELESISYPEVFQDQKGNELISVEIDLLEREEEYLHLGICVSSSKSFWSDFFPLMNSFLVYRDGTVDK